MARPAIVVLLALPIMACGAAAPTVPGSALCEALPAWSEGELDIHQISTGRGNAALFVLPDATTMLVDAGAAADGIPFTDIRPNASRSPGGWIVRYIEAMTPRGRSAGLDYAVVTHLHGDHMGQVVAEMPMGPSGAYRLSGMSEVGTELRVGTLIDRGWPDYAVVPPDRAGLTFANYIAFIETRLAAGELSAEGIRVGAADQIVLQHDRAAHPTFEVRAVAGNGMVWTGSGDVAVSRFPQAGSRPEDAPTENMSSIGLRLSYGAFDYFTGGDIPGVPSAGAPEWHSIEAPVAAAIGETDVHVVNHHGSIDPASPGFLATLRSQVIVLPSWSPTHPSQDSLKRMMEPRLYDGTRDIFATYLAEPTKVSIGARADRLAADHGHIVVRAEPGGAAFRVFVLDDTRQDLCVTGSFGPYTSRD